MLCQCCSQGAGSQTQCQGASLRKCASAASEALEKYPSACGIPHEQHPICNCFGFGSSRVSLHTVERLTMHHDVNSNFLIPSMFKLKVSRMSGRGKDQGDAFPSNIMPQIGYKDFLRQHFPFITKAMRRHFGFLFPNSSLLVLRSKERLA